MAAAVPCLVLDRCLTLVLGIDTHYFIPGAVANRVMEPGTQSGILEAIFSISSDDVFEQLEPADKWRLFQFLSDSATKFSPRQAHALKQLPIVEMCPDYTSETSQFRSISKARDGLGLWLPPARTPESLLDGRFVSQRAAAKASFWSLLGVEQMPRTQLLGKDVLPKLHHMDHASKEQVALIVCRDLDNLLQEDFSFSQ